MSDDGSRDEFARTVVEKVGPTEALLMTMKVILLVGQKAPDDKNAIESAAEAIAAIKRLGAAVGAFPGSS